MPSIFEDFTGFVLREVAKAKGPNRNPIMANLARKYAERCELNGEYVPNVGTLESYGTHIRVALEDTGYIFGAVPNRLDRRPRPLALSSARPFPSASNGRAMRELIGTIYAKAAALYNAQQKRNIRKRRGALSSAG